MNILKAAYTDVVDGLETVRSTGRVTGWIASSHFEDLDDRQRQSKLWGHLEKNLSTEELAALGPIVAMTLIEAETHAESRD